MAECPFIYIGAGRKKEPAELTSETANTDIQPPTEELKVGQPVTINVTIRNEGIQSPSTNVYLYWTAPLTSPSLRLIGAKNNRYPAIAGTVATTETFSWLPSPADFPAGFPIDVSFVVRAVSTTQVLDPNNPVGGYCPVNSWRIPLGATDDKHPCRAVRAIHIVS